MSKAVLKKVKANVVTTEEVRDVITLLSGRLGLEAEPEESSLDNFVGHFGSMDMEEAKMLVMMLVLTPNYIENFADERYEGMATLFPQRTLEEVREKMIRTESIRIAVAIAMIDKYMTYECLDVFLDDGYDYIAEYGLPEAIERLQHIEYFTYANSSRTVCD